LKKFGIIGYGRMGQRYENVLSKMNIKIEFICDKKEIKSRYKKFNDYKKAIDANDVDGIIISTTGPSHFDIIEYAIKNDIKYIICEKPFVTSVADADKVISLLTKSNSRIAINYSRRYSKSYQRLWDDLCKQKIIGEISSIIITSGAGGLSAIGTHFIDLCSFFFQSKMESVYAIPIDRKLKNPRGEEFEDPGGCVVLKFQDNKRAFLDLGDDLGIQPIIEILGEYGRVVIDDINDTILIYSRSKEDFEKPKHLYSLPNPIIKNELLSMGSMEKMIENMINNILSEDEILSSALSAKEKVETYSAIRKSFDTFQVVNLPLDDIYYKREFMIT
jgi:predicted dehydrogenase